MTHEAAPELGRFPLFSIFGNFIGGELGHRWGQLPRHARPLFFDCDWFWASYAIVPRRATNTIMEPMRSTSTGGARAPPWSPPSSHSHDLDLRKRKDQLSALGGKGLLAQENSFLEMPRQDQKIIG